MLEFPRLQAPRSCSMKKVVQVAHGPVPLAPYSQAIIANGFGQNRQISQMPKRHVTRDKHITSKQMVAATTYPGPYLPRIFSGSPEQSPSNSLVPWRCPSLTYQRDNGPSLPRSSPVPTFQSQDAHQVRNPGSMIMGELHCGHNSEAFI